MTIARQMTRFLILAAIPVVGWTAHAKPPALQPGVERLEYRIWTDATSKYKTVAALVDVADGNARLKKRDGRVVAVPLERLSPVDREYVKIKVARWKASGARPAPLETPLPAPVETPLPAVRPELPRALDTRPAPEPRAGAQWPSWRGVRRDGKSPDTGLLDRWPDDGPPLVWKVDRIGQGFSTVAVSDGMVYTTGDVGSKLTIFAMDLDGKPKWKAEHDAAWEKSHPGSRSTPTIDNGRLYLVSGHGLVGCYDAKTGRRYWTRHHREFGGSPPGWGYAESVLIYDNLAVVNPGGRNCIVALDKASGRPVWASQGFTGEAQYGSCYAFEYQGVPMIVAGTRAGIVCVDAKSGRVLWSNPFSTGNTANCPTPVFSDRYVFWANGYGKGGICLELSVSRGRVSAREAWTTKDMVCHHGGYIVHEGYIYGNNGSGWACLDLKTGRRMWQERGVGKGSLCFADGMLYLFGERDGKAGLATCSPEGMRMTGAFSVQGDGPSWAHPVVIGGRLYLRYDTSLYCFDVKRI